MNIEVWGLGKLGLPLASVLTRDGHTVLAYDQNSDHVKWCQDQQSLERSSGVNTVDEPNVFMGADNLVFCTEPEPADLNFIVVPTPSQEDGEFDPFYVEEAVRRIYQLAKRHAIVVIVSTTFPGTVESIHNRYGDKLTVVYNPTFIALGSVVENLVNPSVLLFGVDEEDDVMLVEDVWDNVLDEAAVVHKHVGSYVEAELLKLSINCVLATKISLANSLGKLFSAYGLAPDVVSQIGADPRIGPAYMTPGAPISGPCLPRDNKALQQAAYKQNLRLPISEATEDVDFELRIKIYNDITDQVVEAAQMSRPGSVGILGMTYKYGVPLNEGSIGNWLKHKLLEDGYVVFGYDDHGWESHDLLEDVLKADVVVVTHRELERLSEHAEGEVIHVWS